MVSVQQPARADILEKLFSNDYSIQIMVRLKTTNKVKQLLNLVSKNLKSPSLTAVWENKAVLKRAKNKSRAIKFK